MSFNPDKCEFMKITLIHNTPSYAYTVNNTPIKEVTTAKYFGVIINSHLTWSNHIDFIAIKCYQLKPSYNGIYPYVHLISSYYNIC